MNKKIFEILLKWPKPYISGTDLQNILDKSSHSRHAIIKRAIQEGHLFPMRKDLFLIMSSNQMRVNAFEISTIIYGPSYVSFESALSYHGWIPEAVRTTTCATVKRASEFETPIGIFSYEHIPIKAFPYGVEQHKLKEITLFIANPMKALADIIYVRKRTWANKDDLYEDLRIEPENFENIENKLIADLIEIYPSQRVKKTLSNLQKGLHL